ncbi:conserved Plasmodium protein, unknown function [Plasmodium gallinaceum]|uniref:Uncharacterized protein n=1 Tax=Plasmodium gallinaceum TaxID=5849 RepID=A0A1J1GSC2_PLAGA|nr:conserved Plasmodium protein, unknown function [Plasmodium gallinaceum]CRG95205.1 conserved Plasmodium protein, unknown function [Plasmodium gallinaceum]
MKSKVLYFLLFYNLILFCYTLKIRYIKNQVNSHFLCYIKKGNYLNSSNKHFYIRKKNISNNKFNLNEKKEDDILPFINNSKNHNIFRNKYNYIPSVDEVKSDIENFKKEKSFYFTEHSILELINIEDNIVVINIEGKFFEDINVVFTEITKYLLDKYLGILGVHPYNIKSLNINNEN